MGLAGCDLESRDEAAVLVLGGRGYIGAHLVRYLDGRGRRVVRGTRECFDLLDPVTLRRSLEGLPSALHIVHGAVIDRTVDPSPRAMLRNLEMAVNLAQALEQRPLSSLVFLSSVDVYGAAPPAPLDESTMTAPESPYAIAKLAAEQLLVSSISSRCPVSVLRLPGVYGGDDPAKCIPRRFLEMIIAGKTLTLSGGGMTRRDYVHIDDLCEVILALLEQPRTGLLNIATGDAMTIREIVETIAAGVGAQVQIREVEADRAAAGDLVIDISRLRRAFPKIAIRPMREALSAYARSRRGEAGSSQGPPG